MHFEGTFEVKTSRDKVFEFLLDPQQLSSCLPDLQKLEVRSPYDYTAVVRVGVSFIKGDLTMNLKVSDTIPPSHARLVARGSGIGSTIDLDANMDLSESGGGTSLKWQAEAQVGGRIAVVGQRLINSQAEKIVKQLFGCIQGKLEKG